MRVKEEVIWESVFSAFRLGHQDMHAVSRMMVNIFFIFIFSLLGRLFMVVE